MVPGFKFERALTFGFNAPHVKSVPWLIGLANGLAGVAVMLIVLFASKAQIVNLLNKLEAASNAGENAPEAVMALLENFWIGVWPILTVCVLAYWVVSSILTTTTMRRYIRDEGFSLKFGGDELRVMAVYLGWSVMGLIALAPVFVLIGGVAWSGFSSAFGTGPDPSEAAILGAVGGSFGLMFLIFPVYVFFATRLAPCFALTVKERQVRFFGAWHVSRGRFWPILGAYVILAIAGSVLAGVINQVVQSGFTMALPFEALMDLQSPQEALDAFFSPVILTGLAIIVFVQMATEAIYKHFASAPAALAARYDPREQLGMEHNIDVFS